MTWPAKVGTKLISFFGQRENKRGTAMGRVRLRSLRDRAAFDYLPVVSSAAGSTTGYETIIPYGIKKMGQV